MEPSAEFRSETVALSVVVPTYDRVRSVRRLLEALARQTLEPGAFEVIVVADGSRDGTCEAVERSGAPFRVRCLWQENAGRASACNTGLRAAGGAYVLFLDDDMEPDPELLAAHLAAHRATPGVGVVGAAPIRLEPGASGAARYATLKFNAHLETLARTGEPTGPRDFYSGNFSIARERVLAVGGFDEAFDIYGNEDVDLAIRLREAGCGIVFSTAAIARQHWEKSSRVLAKDSLSKGRTAVLLARKYPELIGALRVGRIVAAGPRRRLVFRVFSLAPINAASTALLMALLPILEAAGLRRSMRFYGLVTAALFWLGALSAWGGRRGPRGL